MTLSRNNRVICHCWDVTEEDLRMIVESGVTDIEWIKRHSGLATGPCQGRWCMTRALQWLRKNYPEYDWSIFPSSRQPLYPIPVSTLAGSTEEAATE